MRALGLVILLLGCRTPDEVAASSAPTRAAAATIASPATTAPAITPTRAARDEPVADRARAPAPFNDHVLALIASYPERGFGGYAWPSRPGAAGTSRDLRVGQTVIARAGTGNHCVGMTFEVFWRALEECAGGAAAVFDVRSARAFRLRWYVPDAFGTGPAEVLPRARLGVPIAIEDARPGDFVQAWNRDGTFGHSMVFLGWERDDAGKLIKIRYWSSQPWTDGIGTSDMAIGDTGFDLGRIHIARAACPGPT